MTEKDKKELVIIGAGPGGYAAAFRAADLGLDVTLIDPEINPGGVCLYRGCIPSKALLHVVQIKQEAAKAAELGLEYAEPRIDLKKINDWKTKVVEKLTKGLGQLSKGRNITYIRGKASFSSESELKIQTEKRETSTLSFQHAVIATGSNATPLPNAEFDHKVIIDSTDALELKKIPKNMLIIGGGYIGLELGSVYANLDCKVSIAEMTSGFLPGVDRDLIKIFEKENEKLFEALYFNTEVEKVTVEKGKAKVILKNGDNRQEKEFEKVLVATGRKPNSDSLNLGKANLEVDEKGFLKADQKRRTNIENIYAIGDMTGEPLLAHKAMYEGRIVAEVIAGEAGAAYDPKAIPGIVFTNPEIAWCGLTEILAEEQGREIKVVKFPWNASGRAATIGTSNGLTKLIIDPETGRILGGGVAGKNAGVLIPQICLAIEMASTAEDISLTIHPHPTLSETIMETAELFYGSTVHLPRKRNNK